MNRSTSSNDLMCSDQGLHFPKRLQRKVRQLHIRARNHPYLCQHRKRLAADTGLPILVGFPKYPCRYSLLLLPGPALLPGAPLGTLDLSHQNLYSLMTPHFPAHDRKEQPLKANMLLSSLRTGNIWTLCHPSLSEKTAHIQVSQRVSTLSPGRSRDTSLP